MPSGRPRAPGQNHRNRRRTTHRACSARRLSERTPAAREGAGGVVLSVTTLAGEARLCGQRALERPGCAVHLLQLDGHAGVLVEEAEEEGDGVAVTAASKRAAVGRHARRPRRSTSSMSERQGGIRGQRIHGRACSPLLSLCLGPAPLVECTRRRRTVGGEGPTSGRSTAGQLAGVSSRGTHGGH